MSEQTAVQQAIDLLAARLDQARHEHDALTEEIQTIEAALASLTSVTSITRRDAPANDELVPTTETNVIALPSGPKVSVRAAVKHILDSNNRAFTATEIRDLIPEEVMEGKTKDQRANTVRTALWSLRTKKQAAPMDNNRTISSKWLKTTEGPSGATEEPSDDAQQDTERRYNTHDHPGDEDSPGNDHSVG